MLLLRENEMPCSPSEMHCGLKEMRCSETWISCRSSCNRKSLAYDGMVQENEKLAEQAPKERHCGYRDPHDGKSDSFGDYGQ